MLAPYRPLPTLGLALGLTALAVPAHATFGPDVLVASVDPAFNISPSVDVAFTPDGVAYGAIAYGVDTPEFHVDVYRSTDDGESWPLSDTIVLPSLSPVGSINDLHVAFSTAPGGEPAVIVIAAANPPDATYWAWAPLAGGTFSSPVEIDVCTLRNDVTADSSGNLYLSGFCDARVSVTKYVAGSGWTPSVDVVIETASRASIDAGDDDRVHLAWQVASTGETAYAASTPNPSGPTDWSIPVTLPTHADLVAVRDIEAFNGKVYVSQSLGSDGSRYLWSDDDGATWPNERVVDAFPLNDPRVLEVESGVLLGRTEPGTPTVSISRGLTPHFTSSFRVFEDAPFTAVEATPHFAANPKWGGVGSIYLTQPTAGGEFDVYFDAEWREAGYLSKSEWAPSTFLETEELDPAIANFDDDPEPEIFYVDGGFQLNILNGDGTPVGPWPIGEFDIWPNFAVADIDFHGGNAVVWGSGDQVLAYYQDGTPVAGYPVTFPGTSQNWVSIGNIDGVNAVLVNTGTHLHALVDGLNLPGFPYTDAFYEVNRGTASAVGDLDGDGTNEIVTMFGRDDDGLSVVALTENGSLLWQRTFEENAPVFKQAPVIAKLDLEFEPPVVMFVSIENSSTHWLRGLDGSNGDDTYIVDFPVADVTSFAVADIQGSSIPEIVALIPTIGAWTAFDPSSAWDTIYGQIDYSTASAPIVEVADTPRVIVLADYFNESNPAAVHVYDPTTGSADEVWSTPFPIPADPTATPASGDVDGDGAAEVFVQSGGSGILFDFVGAIAPGGARTSGDEGVGTLERVGGGPTGRWPMAGGNASRTFCYECEDDVVATPDTDPDPAVGPIANRIAAPRPNPTVAATTIAFAITEPGDVTMGVFDVRGRSVYNETLGTLNAGSHAVEWDGTNVNGARVAPGAYFLSIRVNGADIGGPRRVLVVR